MRDKALNIDSLMAITPSGTLMTIMFCKVQCINDIHYSCTAGQSITAVFMGVPYVLSFKLLYKVRMQLEHYVITVKSLYLL